MSRRSIRKVLLASASALLVGVLLSSNESAAGYLALQAPGSSIQSQPFTGLNTITIAPGSTSVTVSLFVVINPADLISGSNTYTNFAGYDAAISWDANYFTLPANIKQNQLLTDNHFSTPTVNTGNAGQLRISTSANDGVGLVLANAPKVPPGDYSSPYRFEEFRFDLSLVTNPTSTNNVIKLVSSISTTRTGSTLFQPSPFATGRVPLSPGLSSSIAAPPVNGVDVQITTAAVPEPGAWLLLAIGGVGLCLIGRRRTARVLSSKELLAG